MMSINNLLQQNETGWMFLKEKKNKNLGNQLIKSLFEKRERLENILKLAPHQTTKKNYSSCGQTIYLSQNSEANSVK